MNDCIGKYVKVGDYVRFCPKYSYIDRFRIGQISKIVVVDNTTYATVNFYLPNNEFDTFIRSKSEITKISNEEAMLWKLENV